MAKVTYSNLNAVRNKPLQLQLEAALKEAAEAAGVDEVVVVSGGQDVAGANRTGSTRHDLGAPPTCT